MGERKGTKGLELWCRRMTEGYPGVNVTNMTTSWRDGLAFCAIIHHFRPDLIDFSKLNKDDIYHNNELAFRIAERHLGIPALLEPEDMVEFPVPDRLSILTYLSQFYQAFAVGQGKSPARIAPKRPATSPDHGIVSPASTSPPTKMAVAGKIRREPCAKCSLPVFIAERLNVGKSLYHRSCFRCARCNSQLTLDNYYETENDEFCCETCPDEEKQREDEAILTKSMSDEEKSASLRKSEDASVSEDSYSTKFETALEYPADGSLKRNSTLTSSQYSKARVDFMTAQVGSSDNIDNTQDNTSSSDSGNEDQDEDEPPDLPKTKPPITIKNEDSDTTLDVSHSDSGFPKYKLETLVNTNSVNDSNSNNSNQVKDNSDSINISASIKLEKSHDVVTKDDTISAEGDSSSLVKARMRLFETKSDASNDNYSSVNNTDNQVPSDVINNKSSANEEVGLSSKPCDSFKDNNVTKEKEPEETVKIFDVKTPEFSESSVIEIVDESQSVIIIEDDEYPDDLNPFGDDDDSNGDNNSKKAENSLNPFDEEDDQDDDKNKQNNELYETPKPAVRKKIIPSTVDRRISGGNPFDEDDDDDDSHEKIPPQPTKRKVIEAPRISLNPFWRDDEENEEANPPIPKPRVSKNTTTYESKPRESGLSIATSTTYGSSSSLAGTQSGLQHKKKKPAPKPPMLTGQESGHSSLTSSPSHSVTHSPRSTPKNRKAKKAPPPPTSTPFDSKNTPPHIDLTGDEFEGEKYAKDEQNRSKQIQMSQIQSPSSSENSSSLSLPNKSTYGKWKRRKGQAPSRPIPQKRTIKSLPIAEVKRELEVIEIQMQGLEKQGVRLEQIIREKCEGPDINQEDSLAPEVEELVLQLFELVNEKNELFRRQAELMYLRRQQRLDEEHAEVEYQIRCLMLQPEANKTDFDKAREEELINRLVEIVERKNEIIDCLEMDRVREAEEDDSINNQLNLYTQKTKEDKSMELRDKDAKKDKKKHKKEKKFKLKLHKVDADKDIDELEATATSTSVKVKDKKKKKFNIF